MPDEKLPPKNQYGGNSHKSKEAPVKAEPKFEKVISGEATDRKKGLGTKIKETFTGDDMGSVVNYVVLEVLVPATKTLISDMLSQGVERFLFGGAAPRGRTGRGVGYTSYGSFHASSNTRPEGRSISKSARANHDFREITVPTRADVEIILENLGEAIDQYGMATVSDFYSLVGVTGNFVDDQWGWTNLRGAAARRVRDGYLVELPNPIALDS